MGRGPRRLRHQGQGLVLRRLRPRPDQPDPPAARRTAGGRELPALVLPEQVLGQADAEPLPGHLDRRQRLCRRADAERRPHDPGRLLAVHVQRPARHGRTGLRRPAEPALRLVRHLHVPVRPALGPLHDEALRRRRAVDPRLHDRPVGDGHQLHDGRRLRQRVRPDGQQLVQARAVLGGLHGLRGQPRDQGRRRLPERRHLRRHVLHRRAAPARAAVPADRHERLRPGPGAVLHQRRRPDAAGLLPARPPGQRHHERLRDHPRLALQRPEQALQRIHPGPVAHHPDADHQPRRALRHRAVLRPGPRSGDRPVPGVLAQQRVVAPHRRRVGLHRRRHVEALRFGRPLLLRPADGPERPRVHAPTPA